MNYIVYIADEYRKEKRDRNYKNVLDKMEKDVERKRNIANFKRFSDPFLVKKKFGASQGRLIAAKEIVNINGDDYEVIKSRCSYQVG